MNKKPAKKKAAVRNRKQTAKRAQKPYQNDSRTESGELSQFGSIMNKSLELAQTSINLGLNLVQKFGSAIQDDFLRKIADAGRSVLSAKQPAGAAQGNEPSYPDSPASSETEQNPASSGVITNRLPLFPGSSVYIPFSINNEMAAETRTVRLHLEGFAGELTGEELKVDHFSISPASKKIAPLDFEKFVISGTLPINCQGDAYCGFIVVAGAEPMKIPVKIVVLSRT